ncbi:phenol 2-monooxygenase [Gordonia phthalatica]|uniref:propane 2-monooxygenase n=1 Tax=Gordonia phthalatica TaxID=1136941 RepID=A0A0N9MZT5_9ACTN|nr:phenol 2-monooxygenase [Gordonia phthalatica]ALG83749.1 phenol 2-monooxygenase [Gordonia phthalatica]
MQFELRYQTIEPKRQTYQNIIKRFGDEPATRYQEATLDIEPRENFHYRPTWTPDHELYDANYSALKLTDPYVFADPRQYYYTPYVTNRAALHDEFGKTLSYLENRELLAKMPEAWTRVVADVIVPLRHYEAGAQLVSVAGSRFAYGTSLSQCASFAAFDRIGNAQMLSRIGIAAGVGTVDVLKGAKEQWMTGEHLQPLRRLVEEIMVVDDWAEGLLAIDAVDKVLYPALYSGLDDRALLGGAGAYSLVAQYLTTWFADQRKWLDALVKAWRADAEHGEANAATLDRIDVEWGARAAEAIGALTAVVDDAVGAEVSA